ncbi:MAG: hypothetical protein QF541_04985 [Lentisphaeria bacterium]|jgi:hypothetical protein|nr:hypothetical protein [Lentisphaeria bacterium]
METQQQPPPDDIRLATQQLCAVPHGEIPPAGEAREKVDRAPGRVDRVGL